MTNLLKIGTTLALVVLAGGAQAGPEASRPRPGEESYIGPAPAGLEPKTAPEARPQPDRKPETKPETKPEIKPEFKPDPKVEPVPSAGAEPRADRLAQGAAEPRPEPKLDPVPETAGRAGIRKDAAAREESAPLGKPAVKAEAQPAAASGGVGTTRTVLALSAVLALIVLAAGVFKKLAARTGGLAAAMGAAGKAPSGILSILGRYPLDRTTTLVLLKVDRRVLLLAQTRGGARLGAGSLTTLCEISGADEVASIMAKSSAADGGSPAAKFQRALEEADFGEDEAPAARPEPAGAALAAVIQAALKQGRQAVAAKPAAKPAPGLDAAAELRRKLAAMRAKAAVQVEARPRTEVVA